MRNYAPFRTIADSLAAGREIEFSSHGKAYSITNSGGYWHFCCDTDGALLETLCPFSDRRALLARVAELHIEGVPLPRIFDTGDYDPSSLYIL